MSIEFDVSELKQFRDALKDFGLQIDGIIEKAIRNIAMRELRDVKHNTPKDTKTLINGWSIGDLKKNGSEFEITLYNNTEYADYVEFGHRTRDHKKWVPGVFMLTIAENKIDREIENIVDKYLEEAFSKL
ncbi:hypothetical protein ABID14_000216 [Peptoniphilus olsenii]|uniref:HK97 gp10 family phage protein n=1 Tax=Peptoniphilus olsenii TaxID=411570 RepID=A0ABV2J750_9FIRM